MNRTHIGQCSTSMSWIKRNDCKTLPIVHIIIISANRLWSVCYNFNADRTNKLMTELKITYKPNN